MPEGCETIHFGGEEVLVLTKVGRDQESAIKYLCTIFKEALSAEGFDDLTAESVYAFRDEEQSAEDFLRQFKSSGSNVKEGAA